MGSTPAEDAKRERQRQHVRAHYARNKDYYKAKAKVGREKFMAELRQVKSETPCSDCGMVGFHWRMDFDHRPGEQKVSDVSDLVSRGRWKAAREEMQKCDLVCSNCHRDRTHRRRTEVKD